MSELQDALERASGHRRRYDDRRDQVDAAASRLGDVFDGELTTANKTYLANTIRSVDGHNRRVEERQCWNQRKRDRSDSDGDGDGDGGGGGARATRARRDERDDEARRATDAQLEERAAWRARKARALAGGGRDDGGRDGRDGDGDAARSSSAEADDADAKKQRKKEKKRAKKMMKKEAKKKARKILKKERRQKES